ncbi:MAG: indolepyruvate oxidoreductase subunit beta [Clostridia bacterium]|nr:indolepyruvate oxidoreductase subunit beta [Clostridia bacterium]
MKTDIVIVGVGGQGTLLASRILGALAQSSGVDVKVSEVHGMSQRGGSVVTYVRIGNDIASPIVDFGSADYIIAFEEMEAMRAVSYLKKGGRIILSSGQIDPMPVIIGDAKYPENLIEDLSAKCSLVVVDAMKLALEAGEARSVNLVLLGVLCGILSGDVEKWHAAIRTCVPERFLEVNIKAFELGRNAGCA